MPFTLLAVETDARVEVICVYNALSCFGAVIVFHAMPWRGSRHLRPLGLTRGSPNGRCSNWMSQVMASADFIAMRVMSSLILPLMALKLLPTA